MTDTSTENNGADRPMTPDEIIEEAVGDAVVEFRARHPATYQALIRRLGDPIEYIVETLKQDAIYDVLMAQTEKELSTVALVRVFVDVAFKLAEQLLVGGIL